MPIQLVFWGTAVISAVLVAVLIYVWLNVRGMENFVSPFDLKPSTVGHPAQSVIPDHFTGFHRLGKVPHFATSGTIEVSYKGMGARVKLQATNTGSVAAAEAVMRRFRRGGRRAGFIASIDGDRSYIVRHLSEEATIAWTNGPWAFVAETGDYLALQEFVTNYPF